MGKLLLVAAAVSALVLGAGLLFVFAPIVPETQWFPCYMSCSQAFVTAHYSASLSFHFLRVGAVYQGCDGYQIIISARVGPSLCARARPGG